MKPEDGAPPGALGLHLGLVEGRPALPTRVLTDSDLADVLRLATLGTRDVHDDGHAGAVSVDRLNRGDTIDTAEDLRPPDRIGGHGRFSGEAGAGTVLLDVVSVTVHALVTDPPRPGLALTGLIADEGPLTPDAAATLATAMIRDAAVAAVNSGGDLLVNHPTEAQLPADARTGTDPVTELRDLLGGAVNLDEIRFEAQVGETPAERVGNTVHYLLEEEETASVAVLDGRAPTLDHTVLDSAAMKLRRSEVVVGPAPGGRAAYLGLTEPVELADRWPLPTLPAAVRRAVEAGHDVDFLPLHPRVDDPFGLATVVAIVQSRQAAGRRVPEHTAAAIESLDLEVIEADGRGRLRTPASDRT